VAQRDDRLPGLAQPHVVGQDGAASPKEKCDAFDLVREEHFGERDGVLESRIGVARQLQQLSECRGLQVEVVGHDAVLHCSRKGRP
jgi:hypothetical protein